MSAGTAVLVFVLLQRAAELLAAARNTARLRQRGAIEFDAAGYGWLVAMHGAWLLALAVLLPGAAVSSWSLLGLFAVLQIARLWVIASLGERWTTRIVVLPQAPLVVRGPYRYLRHPNYAIVTAEIAVLPLAFGAVPMALVFTAINAALLARRVAIENRALARL